LIARLALIGLVTGVFSTVFGVGGGIVLVPLLIALVGMSTHAAAATSLGAILVTASAGALLYAMVLTFSAAYLPITSDNCCSQYSIVLTFVLIAIVLAFRPQGLFGRAG